VPPTTIENPVINSPFIEPAKHFRVVDGLVSGEIEPKRRPSEFFVPVAKPKPGSTDEPRLSGAETANQVPI
jgi:type III restriction enzyme